MTFVPQPFELIADDLLTALTGGVTREEHRFGGTEEPYSVASADVILESVSVTGQAGEVFVRFERDRDYGLDPATGAIRWKTGSGARQPDTNTRFYVSYYRSEGTRRLTDRNPGSVTFVVARAFAREFAVMQQQLAAVYRAGFLDLAEGDSLDHVAALLGVTRKDARFATGEVLFFRETPALGDITIPAGTLVSTAAGEVFETEERRTLRRGQMAIGSTIRARIEGSAGRVDSRTIAAINRPIFGIDGVLNEEATFFATDRESDEAFRRRVRGALERAGRSSLEAIRLALLEEVPGLNETNVRVTEHADVPGVVEVQFGVGNEVDASFVRRAEAAITSARAAGIRVTHNLGRSQARGGAGETALVVREGARPPARLEPEVLARNPTGVLELQVALLVRLVDPSFTPQQKETIQSELRTRVTSYFDALPMGADVIHGKLIARVVEHEAVVDAVVRIGPLGTAAPDLERNLSTEGRKARVREDAVMVSLMAEPVDIDVLVVLDGRSPAAGTTHEAAVRSALEQLLAAPAPITRTAIEAAATGAVATVAPPLVLPAAGFVHLNARYEDTGRILVDADQVALEEHHVPRWRTIAFRPAEES